MSLLGLKQLCRVQLTAIGLCWRVRKYTPSMAVISRTMSDSKVNEETKLLIYTPTALLPAVSDLNSRL
jgi:hypothetical protein